MFKRVWAQIGKELTQIRRDRMALVLALGLPLFMILLMSNAISLTVSDMPMVVQDLDNSAASRSYVDAFRASINFRVVAWPVDRQPDSALQAGVARAALIIPKEFSRNLARGQATNVQILIDAADANTAKQVSGYAGQITRSYISQDTLAQSSSLVNPQVLLWFNPGLIPQSFYAPGMFVLALSMFPPLLASIAMAKEGDQKTILQVYVSSVSAHEFIMGKVCAFMIIALAEWFLSTIVLLTAFSLHLTGDPTPFLVATILFSFCVAAFGTMVGVLIPSQASAIQMVALGGFLLVLLLSGLIFPVRNIPPALHWVSNLVWGTYYIAVVRDALLQGGGWPAMWFNVLMLGVIGSVFYLIAWRAMRGMQVSS